MSFLKKIFDGRNFQLQKAWNFVSQVNDLEKEVEKLSDDELLKSTEFFRNKLNIGRNVEFIEDVKLADLQREREILFDNMAEIFARVREAAKRVANHRHFDVQLIGGYFLAKNMVTELFTGEGKTLVAPLAAYLYSLTGRGVHVVTVNDYLARRDAEWVGHILSSLGVSIGAITPQASYKFISDEEALENDEDGSIKELIRNRDISNMASLRGANLKRVSKKDAYACDIVYGTGSEFGFDYLRDNMSTDLDENVQRGHYFAIVDECDSILIDEARTPLIISAPASKSNDLYLVFDRIAKNLKKDVDYTVDEKEKDVYLTEDGIQKVEKMLNVKNLWQNYEYAHHLENALKANVMFVNNVDYIVKDNEILIVDEFTGRVLPGRRYSEGIHQAIEAKENVEIKKESVTLATISYQNYFRIYKYLAGMTGTALTEAEEFADIYNLDVIVIPTYKEVIRNDYSDVIYKTKKGKFEAVVKEIKEKHEEGRPILVGTTSIENSELVSKLLLKEGIKHNVLNAKNHEKEAYIIADAGKKGSVTVATNMAGRGTDIKLGEGVKELGGLHIIGTERHESRRIDNQLRGRSGRLGDPGSSRFFVSLEDELIVRFGGELMSSMLDRIGIDESMPIEAGLISKAIEQAQKRVENYNFEIRKHLVEYDDVLNNHREIIYSLRRKILHLLSKQSTLSKVSEDLNESFFNSIRNSNGDDLVMYFDKYSLLDSSTWYNHNLDKFKEVLSPVKMWILQKVVSKVRNILNASISDDSKIDLNEKETLIKDIFNIIPENIINEAISKLDIKDFRSILSVSKIAEVYKTVIISFWIYISKLGSVFDNFEKILIFNTLDKLWVDHLDAMHVLREGISLRSYAQKNPLTEYKNEGFRLFQDLLNELIDGIASRTFKLVIEDKNPSDNMNNDGKALLQNSINKVISMAKHQPLNTNADNKKLKVRRNDPCPCGSGKKYKKCCGLST